MSAEVSPPKNFDDLPVNVVEAIFSYLNYQDVTKARVISRQVYEICGKYMKRCLSKLRVEICKCMNKICNEMNADYNSNDSRYCLKVFNVLKSMQESLDMAIVLNRHLIRKESVCLPIGKMLDKYFNILNAIKNDSIKIDKLHGIQMNIHRNMGFILDYMDKCSVRLRDVIPLGVRAIDLLDLIEDISYKIVATYNIKTNICSLSMKYHLENPKFLTYIPIVPYVKDCKDRLLTVEEQDAIMKYLIMLVNVHNKLEAKTEQYKKELEISRRECMIVKENLLLRPVFCKNVRLTDARIPIKREVLDASSGKVLEIYKNYDSLTCLNQGMTCSIKLRCSLQEAPLFIEASYKNLKQDIELEDPSVSTIPGSVFEDMNPSPDVYCFNFKLRVCIPSKTPEIFEVNFQDGNF